MLMKPKELPPLGCLAVMLMLGLSGCGETLQYSLLQSPHISPAGLSNSPDGISQNMSPASRQNLATTYNSLPLAFEVNQGQTDPQVRYLAHGSGYTLFLTSSEAVLSLGRVPRSQSGRH